ncbi:ectoine/hydroxyectoine ABC transporter permease subunit EhuD [Actimicrobium sp. CCI2.3]|uniref:ectoine/hydroxyectoine ABC transporter permease subunit EhuD n=1 Tax=Actimicrobium sp. CCI2.3 TaxID=3048616 RepID=UPI002AB5CD04|nr:ectoine/hydroxyectoine ABC transporter permease subunit EhuD [Actimicrobium sp. CCI2.3]MDY7573434.1 ectoine/hydroxyectoine ABC transporter permease subunit EhuD [Actimicrobium sp. CCI2.3]MEB0022614.1 ectoine/hydroxyectoine ABC transporter permease subunit EhuD [Actimicrobium sp. CCI2.3]
MNNATLFDWQFAWQILPDLLHASMTTIVITLVAFALALALGLVLAMMRRSRLRLFSWPATGVIEFIRSTPLLIQLYFLFFVLPEYGVTMSALTAGTIGLALHYACYVAEVYRAGLDSVPRGQWEAAKAMSLGPWNVYRSIVLPQAIRPIIPALGNYLIAMFKDTPVLSAITVVELMLQAKNIGSQSFRYIEPITLTGLFFLLISLVVALLVRRLEAHLRMP